MEEKLNVIYVLAFTIKNVAFFLEYFNIFRTIIKYLNNKFGGNFLLKKPSVRPVIITSCGLLHNHDFE